MGSNNKHQDNHAPEVESASGEMTIDISVDEDLVEINYNYLVYARHQIKADRRLAIVTLGISDAVATKIENASLVQLRRLANSKLALVKLRFSDKPNYWDKVLTAMKSDVQAENKTGHMHTLLMLSTELRQ